MQNKLRRIVNHKEAIDDDGDRGDRDHRFSQFSLLHQTGEKAEAKKCGDGTDAKDQHDDSTPEGAHRAGGGDGEEVDKAARQQAVDHTEQVEAEEGLIAHQGAETLLVPFAFHDGVFDDGQKFYFAHDGEAGEDHHKTREEKECSDGVAAEGGDASQISEKRTHDGVGSDASERIEQMDRRLMCPVPFRIDLCACIGEDDTAAHADTMAERSKEGDRGDREKINRFHAASSVFFA